MKRKRGRSQACHPGALGSDTSTPSPRKAPGTPAPGAPVSGLGSENSEPEEKRISELVPCQPIELDPNGVPRFRGNAYVRWMYDRGREAGLFDLHEMSDLPLREPGFDERQGEYVQLMQLLGYSVSGYGDLDFVPREEVDRADAEAGKLAEKLGGSRR